MIITYIYEFRFPCQIQVDKFLQYLQHQNNQNSKKLFGDNWNSTNFEVVDSNVVILKYGGFGLPHH